MRNSECMMLKKKIKHSKLVLCLLLSGFLFAGNAAYAGKNDFQFKKQPEIQQVRPPKPVKIKVHRNAKGEYSWELNGDNADEIAAADKKLRKFLRAD